MLHCMYIGNHVEWGKDEKYRGDGVFQLYQQIKNHRSQKPQKLHQSFVLRCVRSYLWAIQLESAEVFW